MRLRNMRLRLRAVSPAGRLREKKMTALSMEERLRDRMNYILAEKRHVLQLYIERMRGLSPLEKLSSGYSYLEDEEGRNVRSVEQVGEGDMVIVRLKDGRLKAQVTEKCGSKFPVD